MKRSSSPSDDDELSEPGAKRVSSDSTSVSDTDDSFVMPKEQEDWVTWASMRALFPPDTLLDTDFKRDLNIKWGYQQRTQTARRTADGLVVAIKGYEPPNDNELRPPFAPSKVHQIAFFSEFEHPGIPSYLGHFLEDWRINLVFAYDQDAPDLEHLVGERNLSEAEVSHYVMQLAEVLNHFHTNGAVLRAMDPSSVKCYPGYHIKLVCLDSWDLLDPDGFTSGDHGLSNARAPEMLAGGQYGTSVDWWNLGFMMYYLCTYRQPFQDRKFLLYNLTKRTNLQRASLMYSSLKITYLGSHVAHAEVIFPRTMSEPMREMITLLLKKDPMERITSLAALKDLPIYSNIWPPRPLNNLFWG
ncbi:uncharacterized protein MELLADRAFT_87261 [Melampsora larici-populina 98AG31]|uniref:Protein kinase domain-containing protein n=1 Tax=Melampsora larici-populina (strain 98AG31 / pathotype 3-4-7) TaxID=747676 RepID=F4SDS7_MELLP|nr:uncharacterized protein MELLADRAFT_87261 [Melampsora larici-populina 98AG31]EGF97199.1 hypothetical protein MELLADRAFT_87261 [Melampsora larici-populina 98AG31]